MPRDEADLTGLVELLQEGESSGITPVWVRLSDWCWKDWCRFKAEDPEHATRSAWSKDIAASLEGVSLDRETWPRVCERLLGIRLKLLELPRFAERAYEENVPYTRLILLMEMMKSENWMGAALSEVRDEPTEEEVKLAFAQVDERMMANIDTPLSAIRHRNEHALGRHLRRDGTREKIVRVRVSVGLSVMKRLDAIGSVIAMMRKRAGADTRAWFGYPWNDRLDAMVGLLEDFLDTGEQDDTN